MVMASATIWLSHDEIPTIDEYDGSYYELVIIMIF